MNVELQFVRAGAEHCNLVFSWANDPETRRNSFNTAQIPYTTHEGWFMRKIKEPGCFFFIVMAESIPVGQVRVDVDGEISFNVASASRHGGIGAGIIAALPALVKGVGTLVAKVKHENVASQKCFERNGYEGVGHGDFIEYRLLLEKE